MGKNIKCPNCGHIFAKHGKQIFCSQKCKGAYGARARRRLASIKRRGDDDEYQKIWLRVHRYHMPIDGFEPRACPGCGIIFIPKNSRQIYHTKACGAKARNRSTSRHEYDAKRASLSPRNYINALLSHKHRRDCLDIDYMMGIYDAQNGRCALSGRKMTYLRGHGNISTNISIDRIDSSKGYVKGNVQLVCRIVNLIKNEWDQEELIDFCRDIINTAQKREEDNGK